MDRTASSGCPLRSAAPGISPGAMKAKPGFPRAAASAWKNSWPGSWARRQERRSTLARRIDRPKPKGLTGLRPLSAALKPYRLRVAGALIAMLTAAGAIMALGQGMRYLVDHGLVAGKAADLDRGVLALVAMALVLALASYSRFYLVTSIGERVVADLRKKVFRHILTLAPEYFEVTRTGE